MHFIYGCKKCKARFIILRYTNKKHKTWYCPACGSKKTHDVAQSCSNIVCH